MARCATSTTLARTSCSSPRTASRRSTWVLPTPIPGKGRVLTRLSSFWFDETADVMPNHLTDLGLDDIAHDERALADLADRSVVVRKAEPLKWKLS